MGSRAGRYWWVLAPVIVGVAALAFRLVTSHLTWSQTLRESGFIAEMPAPSSEERLLIIAPHPDDEALGCAGLIQQAVQAGAEVHVVVMTNGDASELALIFGEHELPSGPGSFIDLGRKRQRETVRAMSWLGLDASHVHFLGFPNNGLLALWRPEHWRHSELYRSPYTAVSLSPYKNSFTPEAPYCGQQVMSDLMAVLHEVRPTAVFVTAPQDVHPDHWATYCFARYALETIALRGAGWAAATRVYGYLVHWPHYPEPMRAATNLALLPPPSLTDPPMDWQRLSLSPEMALRKLQAIRRYRSQEPTFARFLLRFARANEMFTLLPRVEVAPGESHEWVAPYAAGRRLGGADVVRVRLEVSKRLALSARLRTVRRRLYNHAYIGLDVRGWSPQGAPVISTIYIGAAGEARVRRVGASGAHSEALVVRIPKPGQLELPSIPLPAAARAQPELFLTCWGSIRDRITAPAVICPVRLRPPDIEEPG